MADDDFSMQDEMRRAFAMLSGKWKLEIMWLLHQRMHRFGELRKGIPGMLTAWWEEYGRSLPARPTARGRKATPKPR